MADLFAQCAWRAWRTEHPLFDVNPRGPDVSGCGREVFCYAGNGSWHESRAISEVLSSRLATGFERMMLLRQVLEGAGVRSRLGSYTARYTELADSTFPSLEHLNRPILYLPQQAGLRAPLWIDPTCEACEPGAVSPAAIGMNAWLFDGDAGDGNEKPNITVYQDKVAGRGGPPTSLTRRYDATVMQNGSVELSGYDELSGRWAAEFCGGEHLVSGYTSKAHERALRLSAASRHVEPLEPRCELERGAARTGFSAVLPAHALYAADGRTLYVPLTLLDPDFSDTFFDEERTMPIAFLEAGHTFEYRLVLRVPPGFVLADASTESAEAPGVKATLEIHSMHAGIEVHLWVEFMPGFHPPTTYAQFRRLGDFLRDVRSRVLELKRQ